MLIVVERNGSVVSGGEQRSRGVWTDDLRASVLASRALPVWDRGREGAPRKRRT
jgi:hypothetical protein